MKWCKNKSDKNKVKRLMELFSMSDTKESKKKAEEQDERIRAVVAQLEPGDDKIRESVELVFSKNLEKNKYKKNEQKNDLLEQYREGNRNWMWQENLFCLMAYLYTLGTFFLDILTVFPIEMENGSITFVLIEVTSIHCLGLVAVLLLLWGVIDCKFRGNKTVESCCLILNRYMPCLTMVFYVLHYTIKGNIDNCEPLKNTVGWILLAFVSMSYLLIAVWELFRKWNIYKSVDGIVKKVNEK